MPKKSEKYNPTTGARLQAIIDGDPQIQEAVKQYQLLMYDMPTRAAYNGPGGVERYRRDVKAAVQRVEQAMDRQPELKANKVAQGTIGTGYELKYSQADYDPVTKTMIPRAPVIGKEKSEWGHVWRDYILPAAGAGAIVAAPAIIGSQAAAGAGGAGSGAGAGAAAPLASSAVPGAGGAMLAGAPVIGSTGATVGAAGGAGGGALSALGGKGGLARMAGQGLGAISQGQAQNRGVELGGQFDLERLLMDRETDLQNRQIDREREGREGGLDAWKRLLMAERTLSPGPRPQLSRYSIAPRTATGAERTGAEAMSAEVLARLLSGNPIAAPSMRPLEVDRTKFKPGAWERIAGYAAPIATAVGSYYGGR